MILFLFFSRATVYATAPFRFDQPWGGRTRDRSFSFAMCATRQLAASLLSPFASMRRIVAPI
jgi:hypothetical protein